MTQNFGKNTSWPLDKFIIEVPLEIAILSVSLFIIFILAEVIIIKKKRYKFIQ